MSGFSRESFQLPAEKTYLNCAYMSPLATRVLEAGIAGMRRKLDPSSISATDFFTDTDRLRSVFARMISGRAGQVAVIPSASYGLSTVAKNMKMRRGARAVVVKGEFPSNYYPWQALGCKMVQVSPPAGWKNRGKIWNERLLEAIKPGTALVALGNVHWADGTWFDLMAVREAAERVGAALIIDGTQSVGAMPFNVSRIRPDALVCAGYKWLMGPYAIGLSWFGDRFSDGKPLEENWINRKGSRNFTSLVDYETDYQPGMARFDAGERSNFILVPMMLEALQMVAEWKPQEIQNHCAQISRSLIFRLRDGGWWVEDDEWRGHHLFGIRPPRSTDSAKFRQALMRAGISVSFRGEFIRISPHVYNTEADLDKLAEALKI